MTTAPSTFRIGRASMVCAGMISCRPRAGGDPVWRACRSRRGTGSRLRANEEPHRSPPTCANRNHPPPVAHRLDNALLIDGTRLNLDPAPSTFRGVRKRHSFFNGFCGFRAPGALSQMEGPITCPHRSNADSRSLDITHSPRDRAAHRCRMARSNARSASESLEMLLCENQYAAAGKSG